MKQSIEIQNVSKHYGRKQILYDISFSAHAGKITAFLGPNGAGKSTTLRILLGLDGVSDGKATIGEKIYSEWREPLKIIGASFDGIGSPPDRTVFQHLRIAATSNGISKDRITEVLSITGIAHKSSERVGNLSLGEGQRLGIATALLGDPQFLILDEPTNGLDPGGIRWFRNFIREQADLGKTVLLSSHILSEVEAVTDDIVIIDHGRIIENGRMNDVIQNLPSLESLFFKLTEGGEEYV